MIVSHLKVMIMLMNKNEFCKNKPFLSYSWALLKDVLEGINVGTQGVKNPSKYYHI